MKKILKSTICLTLVTLLLFGTTLTAFAASPSVGSTVTFKTGWTDLVVVPTSNSNGVNGTIYISATTTSASGFNPAPCDIRMLGKSGNELWAGYDVVPGNGQATEFYCGADVYKVQIRVNSKYGVNGTGSARTWYKN